MREEQLNVRDESSLRGQWSSLRSLVVAWFIAVLTIWVAAVFIARFAPPVTRDEGPSRTAVERLSTWDGAHYAHIAANGYSVEGQDRRRFGYFPLLPAVSRLLGGREHAPLAGILLSQICLLGSIILLSKLMVGERQLPLPQQPGFWLLVNPLGFFFHVFYTSPCFSF